MLEHKPTAIATMVAAFSAGLTGAAFIAWVIYAPSEWAKSMGLYSHAWGFLNLGLPYMVAVTVLASIVTAIIAFLRSVEIRNGLYGRLPKYFRKQVKSIRDNAKFLGDHPSAEILEEICNNMVALSLKLHDEKSAEIEPIYSDLVQVTELSHTLTTIDRNAETLCLFTEATQSLRDFNRKITLKKLGVDRQATYIAKAQIETLARAAEYRIGD